MRRPGRATVQWQGAPLCRCSGAPWIVRVSRGRFAGGSRAVAGALPCAAARALPCAVAGRSPVQLFRRSPVQLFRRSLDCSLVARPVRRRFRTVARALPCAAARARPCAVAGRSPVQMFRRSLDFRLSRGRFAGGPECGTRDFLSLAATGALPRSLRRRSLDPAVS